MVKVGGLRNTLELVTCCSNSPAVTLSGELDANRPVPFRLTPNIAEFVTPVGVNGVMTSAMVAGARCLVEPQFSIKSVLRAILRDEMIAWHKKVSQPVIVDVPTVTCAAN